MRSAYRKPDSRGKAFRRKRRARQARQGQEIQLRLDLGGLVVVPHECVTEFATRIGLSVARLLLEGEMERRCGSSVRASHRDPLRPPIKRRGDGPPEAADRVAADAEHPANRRGGVGHPCLVAVARGDVAPGASASGVRRAARRAAGIGTARPHVLADALGRTVDEAPFFGRSCSASASGPCTGDAVRD